MRSVALLRDHKDVEYNIEGNPFQGHYMELVTTVAPTQATLVPDDPGQRTSDHGWNMGRNGHRLKPIIEKLREQGTRVSVFMDPDPEQIAQVPVSGADRIELYTEDYAKAYRSGPADAEVERYRKAADTAGQLGLGEPCETNEECAANTVCGNAGNGTRNQLPCTETATP